jgi:ABC-type multidrug transport system fused ATPase/permease subunit
LIVAGVYLIHERMLTMGGLIAVTMLGGRAIAPLGQAVGMLMQFQNARMSLETLDKLMAQPVERRMPRPSSIARIEGEIEFRDVSFSYPGQASRRCRTSRCALRQASTWSSRPHRLGQDDAAEADARPLPADRRRGAHRRHRPAPARSGRSAAQRRLCRPGRDMLFYGTLRENISHRRALCRRFGHRPRRRESPA